MKRCLLKLEYKLRIYSLIAFMYILGCGKEKFDINNFAVPPEKEIYDLTLLEQSEPQKKNDTSLCVTEKYKYAPGYEEPVLYDPTSDVIYPGSVLKYESIESGQYIEYVGVKKPITLSISDPNANLTSVVVKDPTLSNVREAIKSLLSSNPTGATTALIVSDFKEIISKEHFELAIGGHFGGFWGSVESDFRFNSQENFRRFMFNFTQTYFTIDVNSKDGNDFFEDNENVFNGNISYSPAYVSSIKYGRRIIITLESKSSSTNLDASLQADFNSLLGGSGSLSVSSELNRSISSQSVQYLIVGGGSLEAVKTIKDIKELKNLLVSGANYSRDSPGAPLSFKLKYLKDNSTAAIFLSKEFTVTRCNTIEGEPYILNLKPLDIFCPKYDPKGGDKEFNGNGPIQTIDFYLKFKKNKIFYDLSYDVKETKPDNTHGYSAVTDVTLFTLPSNYEIISLNGTTGYSKSIEDLSHEIYAIPFSKGPIDRIELQGDNDGEDLGKCDRNHSYVQVYFRQNHSISVRKL